MLSILKDVWKPEDRKLSDAVVLSKIARLLPEFKVVIWEGQIVFQDIHTCENICRFLLTEDGRWRVQDDRGDGGFSAREPGKVAEVLVNALESYLGSGVVP